MAEPAATTNAAAGTDAGGEIGYDVVVPTVGRACLPALLRALTTGPGPLPGRVVLVDDRRWPARIARPLLPDGRAVPAVVPALPAPLESRVVVLSGNGRGPAAARNTGWRAANADWVAFLDDDVVPEPGWRALLAADLAGVADDVAGSQGQVRVPLPPGRRPTDWERNVHGLEHARWATADLAYRRAALAVVGGFDERFTRAYREDTDLGLRLVGAGWRIATGRRRVLHPVRRVGPLTSLQLQAGNADDVLLLALHGPRWRRDGGVPMGRRPRHLAITAAGAAGLAGVLLRRRRMATLGLAVWMVGTAELAVARIAPGPMTPAEIGTMLATSALLPVAATRHWLAGVVLYRRLLAARFLRSRGGGA